MATGERPVAEAYPVLSEHALTPLGLGLARLRQREVTLPPPHGPGTVRVFAVKGRYLPEPSSAKMRAATYVSIVDISPRMMRVSIEMQPPPGAIACRIWVSFRCQVIEPATVAQLHLHDLQSALDAYLAQSSRLRGIAVPGSPNQLHDTYLMIQQRISAQFSVQPPEVPGMRIELGSIQVDVS